MLQKWGILETHSFFEWTKKTKTSLLPRSFIESFWKPTPENKFNLLKDIFNKIPQMRNLENHGSSKWKKFSEA